MKSVVNIKKSFNIRGWNTLGLLIQLLELRQPLALTGLQRGNFNLNFFVVDYLLYNKPKKITAELQPGLVQFIQQLLRVVQRANPRRVANRREFLLKIHLQQPWNYKKPFTELFLLEEGERIGEEFLEYVYLLVFLVEVVRRVEQRDQRQFSRQAMVP